MLKKTLTLLAFAGAILAPVAAEAATSAVVTTNLNIRTGPSTAYQDVGTIPDGSTVRVYGCLRGYNWCDVSWAGERGWVSGNYLLTLERRYYRRPISRIGVSLGLPVIVYDRDVYVRRHYHGRPSHHARHERREVRHDRHEVRQERRDVRRARHELRQERRHGHDVKAERRHVRQERRDVHRAKRELRRDRRD